MEPANEKWEWFPMDFERLGIDGEWLPLLGDPFPIVILSLKIRWE